MQKYKLSFKQSFFRSSIYEIECLAALIIIIVICFLQSCTVKKMSLEEARKVSISMKDEAFVPPPRT